MSRLKEIAAGILLWCFGLHFQPAQAQAPVGKVKWAGAMHLAMEQGDLSAHASLDSLLRKPHLYALGPMEGLQGELLVTDGNAYLSQIISGKPVTTKTQQGKAAFLVYAYVPDWQGIPFPASVTDLQKLEQFLGEAAVKAGLKAGEPFPFRIIGEPNEVTLHVVNLPTELPPGTEIKDVHEESLVKSTIKSQEVEVLGFYSTQHAGVFTHHTSKLHAHVRLTDNSRAGHLESISLKPGMKLFLPK